MKTHKLIYTVDFPRNDMKDVDRISAQNALQGDFFNSLKPEGVGVVEGFATTPDAYRALLAEGELEYELRSLLSDFDPYDIEELKRRGHAARVAVLDMPLPLQLRMAVLNAYERLCQRLGYEPALAVRSSTTAGASFTGGGETFLNVRGSQALLRAVHLCFASLFRDHAISYRARLGYDHLNVAISVAVQPMVNLDAAFRTTCARAHEEGNVRPN